MSQKPTNLAIKAFSSGTYSVKILNNLGEKYQIIFTKSLFLPFLNKIGVFSCEKRNIPSGTFSVKKHHSNPICNRIFAIKSTIMFFFKYSCIKYISKILRLGLWKNQSPELKAQNLNNFKIMGLAS